MIVAYTVWWNNLLIWSVIWLPYHSVFGDYTMETILAAAFGCEVQVQRGEVDEFVTATKMVLDGMIETRESVFATCNAIFLLSKWVQLVIPAKYIARNWLHVVVCDNNYLLETFN